MSATPLIPDVSHAELEAHAMAGDRAAFSQVVRLHQRSVFFTALRIGRGDEQFAGHRPKDIPASLDQTGIVPRGGFGEDLMLRIATNWP